MWKIADKMPNGKVVDAPTAKELTVSFQKVVINLYERNENALQQSRSKLQTYLS